MNKRQRKKLVKENERLLKPNFAADPDDLAMSFYVGLGSFRRFTRACYGGAFGRPHRKINGTWIEYGREKRKATDRGWA